MNCSKVILAVALTMVVGSSVADWASAQRGGGFMRGGGAGNSVSEVDLLAMDEVLEHLQDDYDLSEESMKQIQSDAQDAKDELQEERRAIMGDMRNMDESERVEAMEELQDVMKEINTDTFRTIKKQLSKAQLDRLKQLKIQRMGPAALQDPVFQEMLGFTKEQVGKMEDAKEQSQEMRQEMMAELREQMQSGGGFDRDAIREAMTEMQTANKKNVMAVLTDSQKKTFDKMKGESFEFPEPAQRRGRGRGGN